MTDEPENLVLEMLRALRNDIADFRRALTERIDRLEGRMAAVEHHIIALSIDIGNLNARMASVEQRLDRIEKRLGLIDA